MASINITYVPPKSSPPEVTIDLSLTPLEAALIREAIWIARGVAREAKQKDLAVVLHDLDSQLSAAGLPLNIEDSTLANITARAERFVDAQRRERGN